MSSSAEESSGGEEEEMRKMVQAQNRKKKKSGGFQAMGLSGAVFKAIIRKGYKLPTPIQRKTIPLIMEGKDVVAMARTGSGKTAAFLVPMLERMKMHLTTGARALILSPTRELALQTLKFTKELGKFMDLKAAVILGGDKIEDQFSAMHEHPDIIIATPGRLLHVLVEMNKALKEIVYVVFDEADRLFEMGFADQLREILHRVPEARQTLLFSATLPKTLVSFAQAGLSDPVLVRLDVDTKLSAQLKMSFLSCRAEDKTAVLLYLLRHVISDKQLTVVFVATKHHVEYLYTLLTRCGIDCTYIYSSLDQTARKIHVAKFTAGQVKVMLVTDLAARGIDIPHLDNVINFHFPAKAKLFVHRVGRVARAGRSGTAYSLVAMDEVAHLVDLHVFLGRPLQTVPPAGQVTDEDGYFGNIPRNVISDQWDELRLVNSESVDLQNQKRVSENAYMQYLRSRPPAASESIKRAKVLEREKASFGHHPIFNGVVDQADDFHQHALSVLRNCKGRSTIFEINATARKACHSVMRDKRKAHDHIIQKVHENTSSAMALTSRSKEKFSSQNIDEPDEELLKVFEHSSRTADEVRNTKNKGKKKKTKSRTARDEENYVLYQPANTHTEAGYKIEGFKNEINNAVLDFTGDDEENMRSLSNTRRWDRKRKRFTVDSGEGKSKKVKTESGNWIPASYKSNLYKTWVSKEKVDNDDSDDDGRPGHRHGPKGRRGGLQVSGTRGKKWHTKGMQTADAPPGGSTKRKFKGGKHELKSRDTILSERRKKARVQAFQKHRQVVRAKKKANRRKK